MSEDKKEAVNIGVTLSTQIIAASLTMVAVVGGFVTFTIDKREVGVAYFTLVGLAFFSFVYSIILGGKGINIAREDGFSGNWNLRNTKTKFNRQAIFALLGIIFFSITVFIGTEKSDGLEKKVDEQGILIQKMLLQQNNYQEEILELKKMIKKNNHKQAIDTTQADNKK